jgi:hypothetical protein
MSDIYAYSIYSTLFTLDEGVYAKKVSLLNDLDFCMEAFNDTCLI